MAGHHVVVVFDDVGAVAHAHELRVVGSLDLRRADAGEALHDEVSRQGGIPVLRQQASGGSAWGLLAG